MIQQIKLCLFGHHWNVEVFPFEEGVFEKGTMVKVYSCGNCPQRNIWIFPPKGKGDPYIVDYAWGRKYILKEE